MIASAGERSLASASASWVRCTIRIASGIRSPFTLLGWPLPFHRSNVHARASRTGWLIFSRAASTSPASQQDRKFICANFPPARQDRGDRAQPRDAPLARQPERHGVPQHLGRVRRVVGQRPAPGRDVVAEHRRHLVSMSGAAEVTKLRAPVRGVPAPAPRAADPASQTASSVERSWDSSGWPNALSWPSVRTATSSPRLSSSMRHPTPEADSARVRRRSGILPMPGRVPARSVPVTGFGDLPGEDDEHVHHQAGSSSPRRGTPATRWPKRTRTAWATTSARC